MSHQINKYFLSCLDCHILKILFSGDNKRLVNNLKHMKEIKLLMINKYSHNLSLFFQYGGFFFCWDFVSDEFSIYLSVKYHFLTREIHVILTMSWFLYLSKLVLWGAQLFSLFLLIMRMSSLFSIMREILFYSFSPSENFQLLIVFHMLL